MQLNYFYLLATSRKIAKLQFDSFLLLLYRWYGPVSTFWLHSWLRKLETFHYLEKFVEAHQAIKTNFDSNKHTLSLCFYWIFISCVNVPSSINYNHAISNIYKTNLSIYNDISISIKSQSFVNDIVHCCFKLRIYTFWFISILQLFPAWNVMQIF